MSDMDVSGTIGAVLNQKSGEIYSVSPDATVFEAVQLMDAKNVGALVVMEGERLVGIISERDYTRKIMLRGKRSRETKVAEIMSTNVFTTNRREGVETCLRLMTDQHIRHLPVVDDDKVVGNVIGPDSRFYCAARKIEQRTVGLDRLLVEHEILIGAAVVPDVTQRGVRIALVNPRVAEKVEVRNAGWLGPGGDRRFGPDR